MMARVTHARPAAGETRTSCCGLTLLELAREDLLSDDPEEVTCRGVPQVVVVRGGVL